MGRVREEKGRRGRSEKRKSEKKEDAGGRKGRKVAIHCVFPMICGSGGSKSRLAKAAGAEPSGQSCAPLWREAHLQVNMHKARHSRTTFWKLTCRKSGRRSGAKHISKSKASKTDGFGALLEVRCRKSARCCSAKHIPSQNIRNTTCVGRF